MAVSISEYISSFVLADCSEKNLLVPNIEELIEDVSINPADPSSSIFGKSDNFCILK